MEETDAEFLRTHARCYTEIGGSLETAIRLRKIADSLEQETAPPEKEWDPADDSEESIDRLMSMVSLVAEPLRMPTREALAALKPEQRVRIVEWCGSVHLSASDNDIDPGPIPVFFDEILAVPCGQPLPDGPTDIWGQPIEEDSQE